MKRAGSKTIKDAMRAAINSQSSYNNIRHLLIPIETCANYLLYSCRLTYHTLSIFYLPDTPGIEGILKHAVKISDHKVNTMIYC